MLLQALRSVILRPLHVCFFNTLKMKVCFICLEAVRRWIAQLASLRFRFAQHIVEISSKNKLV